MTELLGIPLLGFVIVTLFLFGFCAFMTGQALANGWNRAWKLVPYGALLACGDRFLGFALAGGDLNSISGFVISWLVLTGISLAAFRFTQARKMVSQYPWLYEPAGPFGWRSKA
ncbi:MAG: hypothetical protein KI792_03620 [Alphaproteobacteria bacterium]|nr:hypothetical protein [Alphaproteobacteria bacterium SS10]